MKVKKTYFEINPKCGVPLGISCIRKNIFLLLPGNSSNSTPVKAIRKLFEQEGEQNKLTF